MCFENGLPRQSADWLAMTGFFDSLQRPALPGLSFPLKYGKINVKRLFYFIAVFLARRSRATEKGGELYHNALRYGIMTRESYI